MLGRLLRAGADAFRVNMSHGDHATTPATIEAIRALEKKFNRPIDDPVRPAGPQAARRHVRQGRPGDPPRCARFTLDRDPTPGDATRVELPHPELFEALARRASGCCSTTARSVLRVTVREPDQVDQRIVEVGGAISDRKGVNVPDVGAADAGADRQGPPRPRLRDRAAAPTGSRSSFVQRPEDLAEARRLMGGTAALLAKIEKPAGDRPARARSSRRADARDGRARRPGRRAAAEEVPPLQKQHRRDRDAARASR